MSAENNHQQAFIYMWLAFLTYSFVFINYTFIAQLFKFTGVKAAGNFIYQEFAYISIMGMSNIILFASLYEYFGLMSNGNIVKEGFITSLYFSIVTWTTLGYGDYSPIPEMKLIASLEAIVGYFYMAILVGLFFILLNSREQKA